jgi:drug/metabolite transporter (DMT)-like permease
MGETRIMYCWSYFSAESKVNFAKKYRFQRMKTGSAALNFAVLEFRYMQEKSGNQNMSDQTKGQLLGLLAVIAFSLTLPLTRSALVDMQPIFIGTGRAVLAAFCAAIFLLASRARLPTLLQIRSLIWVGMGAVIGFPILTALAMTNVDSSHGGVVLGILPLATAGAGFLFAGERPSPRFWVSAVIGSALVVAFSLLQGLGALRYGDLALFGAVLCACVAYSVGARLSKQMGGLVVISWAILLAFPIVVIPAIRTAPDFAQVSLGSWLDFLYVGVISQFLGFWPWYRGMALGGIAKIGQIQLLQPFFTFAAAWLWLGERLDVKTVLFACAVLLTVMIGRSAPVGSR